MLYPGDWVDELSGLAEQVTVDRVSLIDLNCDHQTYGWTDVAAAALDR